MCLPGTVKIFDYDQRDGLTHRGNDD